MNNVTVTEDDRDDATEKVLYLRVSPDFHARVGELAAQQGVPITDCAQSLIELGLHSLEDGRRHVTTSFLQMLGFEARQIERAARALFSETPPDNESEAGAPL